jgi:hypothetical protein
VICLSGGKSRSAEHCVASDLDKYPQVGMLSNLIGIFCSKTLGRETCSPYMWPAARAASSHDSIHKSERDDSQVATRKQFLISQHMMISNVPSWQIPIIYTSTGWSAWTSLRTVLRPSCTGLRFELVLHPAGSGRLHQTCTRSDYEVTPQ